MSYKIYERRYVDGVKYIARVKLPSGKWRNYPTYQTDLKKAEKVAQRLVKALSEGEDPNAFGQRGRNAGVPRSKQHSLATMIETYLDEKHASWAPSTFPGYKIPLILFRDFMGDVNVRQIKLEDLFEFRKFLNHRGCTRHPKGAHSWKPLKPKTLRNYESAIQFFLTWAGKRQGFVAPKIDLLSMPRTQAIKYWRADECIDLLRAAREIVVHGQPFSLYMGFLFSTGMRKTEAALTKWEWVDMEERSIKVPGVDPDTGQRITKNGNWRMIPISDTLLKMLQNWPTPKQGRLFLMSEQSGHIADNFDRVIKRANKIRQAEGKPMIPRLTPHSTRHTYAVLSLKAGMKLYAMAQILGHASIDTTMHHYAKIALTEMHDEVTKAGSYHAALSQGMSPPPSSKINT